MGKKAKRRRAEESRARGARDSGLDVTAALTVTATLDIPVLEASGLALWAGRDGLDVVAIGDRDATVAIGRVEGGSVPEWRTVDLAGLDGAVMPIVPSQIEAIDADNIGTVVLVTEDPPAAFVLDVEHRRSVARLRLLAPPGSALHGHWDDPSSRGEGVVLMTGGHLLVAKEKHPAALVEFGPAGAPPLGVSPQTLLGAGQPYERPSGDGDLVALAMWQLTGAAAALGDVSDLTVAPDGALLLLSDQSAALALLPTTLPAGGGTIDRLDQVWTLPVGTKKAEGLVVLPDGRALVCCDTRSTRGNGLLLDPPVRPAS